MLRRMPESLYQKVDRQLLADLSYYQLSHPGNSIDWSRGCPEGHEVSHLGETFESNSEVYVLNDFGSTIAGGWVDFFYNEEDDYFLAYWDSLYVYERNITPRTVSKSFERRGAGIPTHIWNALPESYQKSTPKSDTTEFNRIS